MYKASIAILALLSVLALVALPGRAYQAQTPGAAADDGQPSSESEADAAPGTRRASAESRRSRANEADAESGETAEQIERGRYLVHHVAKCVECHTPRTSRGELIQFRLLQGAPIPIAAPYPNLDWAFEAPPLVGLAGWASEEVAILLQTGRRSGGRAPRAPMPEFRMNEADAEAVVQYLLSVRR